MDCSPSGSSVHGILKARILEWVAILFSRGSSQPRDWNRVFSITGRFFTCLSHWQILYLSEPLADSLPVWVAGRFFTCLFHLFTWKKGLQLMHPTSPTFSAWAMGFPDERVCSYRPQCVWFSNKSLKGTFFKNQLWPKEKYWEKRVKR